MNIDQPSGPQSSGFKFLFRALQYKNYRLFFCGQSISLVGTWMQAIAASWLVYRLTHSAFLLGMVGFLGQLPIFLVLPFSGVLADRLDRRKILLVTQNLAMIQAFILSLLVFSGTIKVWQIIVLSIFLGIVTAFDIPTRQSFVVEMVHKKEDLANAIALNSSMVNGARLVGPAIAGVLIALVGEGMCFLLNAISYLAAIFALMAMDIKPQLREKNNIPILEGLKEGVLYAFGHRAIRYILLLLVLVSLLGVSSSVLMPVFAKEILGGDARVLGLLMGSVGLGALGGAFYLAQRRSVYGLENDIIAATILFGLGLAIFSFSHTVIFSLLIMLLSGFGMIVTISASNTVLQFLTSDDKRGRVMSFFSMSFMGVAPFGSLLAGSLADRIGAAHTVFISGASCIIGALFLATRISVLKHSVRNISL